MIEEKWQQYRDMKGYRIDGQHFSKLEELFDEISLVLVPDAFWGRNRDASN